MVPDPIILGVGALSLFVGILIGFAWAAARIGLDLPEIKETEWLAGYHAGRRARGLAQHTAAARAEMLEARHG